MAKRKLAETENVTATKPLPVQPEPEQSRLVRMAFGLQTVQVSVNGRTYSIVDGMADVDPRDAGTLQAQGFRLVV